MASRYCCWIELALAVEAGEGLGREGTPPGALVAGDGYLKLTELGELVEGVGSVVVGCAYEGNVSAAVFVRPAGGGGKWMVGS